MNKTITVVTFALLFIAVAVYVQAEVTSPISLTEGTSSSRDLSGVPSQTVDAQGGNVTQVNIDALTITRSWQGYYGNITGSITLDNANNDTFYNWSLTTPQGEVYASRAASPTFSGIGCTDATERTTEETYLGHTAVDGDSVTNTFNSTTHPAFNVSSTAISSDSCYSTNAFVNTGQDTSRFYQVLLSDASSNLVYTTIIDSDQTGFDGSAYDFQLLVGENEHSGSEGTTTYYFFVELD